MNKQFHQLVPILALKQMPDKFRAFFVCDGYTEDQLKTDADLPDLVDKDNIESDPFCRHAHSYKLREVTDKQGNKCLDWIDGDCLQRLKGLAEDAHDFLIEGRLSDFRYALAKMTHYRIDALTYPHLWHGTPWTKYHTKFEDELGRFITEHSGEIGPLKFEPYVDVYRAARASAKAAWYKGRELVETYEEGGRVSDEQALAICRECVKGVGDLWLTLAEELKIV